MTEKLQVVRNEAEDIEPEDDTPKAGDFLEYLITETIRPYDRDKYGNPRKYHFFYTDADGPAVSIRKVEDDDEEESEVDFEEDDDWADDDDEEIEEVGEEDTIEVTRWVFVAVMHVGSNYLLLQDLHRHEYRVHLDDWREVCRKVDDADARIQSAVTYWQARMTQATKEIGQLMRAVGIEGRQLPSDTQAIAVRVGTGPAEEHKTALMETKERLPDLYGEVERAGKNMGKWMGAKSLPLQSTSRSLSERQADIDSRLLAVDLYAGLSEGAKLVKRGKQADMGEKLRLMQRMHFMDEECLLDYQHGGMDYTKVKQFDQWLRKEHNFERLFPFQRCAVAFRVRRHKKHREAHSWADFIRIRFEEEMDKKTFLYVRNGKQLWRVNCAHDFGDLLFPDLAHSTIAAGQELWAKKDGEDLRTVGDLEQEYGEDWEEIARGLKYHPFNDTSVYFDDIQASISKMMGEYNRVAVLIQGLLDRSQVFHPHPPIRLWDADSFSTFVELVFDKGRALTDGDPPDFEAYRAKLEERIAIGSFTLGQQECWWDRERAKANRSVYDYRQKIYSDNKYWWPRGDDGPGFVGKVTAVRGGKAKFEWTREGRRQKPGSDRWDDNYPIVNDSIRVDIGLLFNVSAYKPGDYKQFFNDPRTREDYLKWAPVLLAAEEWHASERGKVSYSHSHATPCERRRYLSGE